MGKYEDFKVNCALNIEQQASDTDLLASANEFFNLSFAHLYSYNFEFLGRPIIQYPQDIVAIQELIWQVKPELIIETGVAHGGSLIMSAAMLSLLDVCDAHASGNAYDPKTCKRKVLGVDIEIRDHNRVAIEQHPMATKIELLEGSSTDKNIIDEVKRVAKRFKKIMVLLDSNHTQEHVLRELEAYAPLTSLDSYCVVFDTVIENMASSAFPDRQWGPGDNPKTAALKFLEKHPEFEADNAIDSKLLISVAPGGYLRRVKL